MRTLIEARGVAKAFEIPEARRSTIRERILSGFRRRRRERLPVLDGVDLELREGEAVGIMGRNGCGKSTLLKILAEIYVPDRGSVHHHAAVTPILELGVGWNPELDAIDNVELLGTVMGLSLAELDRAMDSILEFAEVRPFAALPLKHYSSGMASRLAYAVAFAAVREVLILDEVFAVGDQGFKERCRQRYRELRAAGHAVLLVSHEPQLIVDFCDRAVLLDNGRIGVSGSPRTVASAYLRQVGSSGDEPRPRGSLSSPDP